MSLIIAKLYTFNSRGLPFGKIFNQSVAKQTHRKPILNNIRFTI